MQTKIPSSRLSNEIPVSSFSQVKKTPRKTRRKTRRKTPSKTRRKTPSKTRRKIRRKSITPRLRTNDSLSIAELAKQIANEEKQPRGCIGKACKYIKSKLTRRRGGKRKRRTRKR